MIHVFTLRRATGAGERDGVIDVPPPPATPPPQRLPADQHEARSWPQDLAISPDGKTLLAALNLANAAAIIDTALALGALRQRGRYPYGAAITRDGKLGLVSNETDATVRSSTSRRARSIKTIAVGPHLSHPEGIAIDPKRDLAYVAVDQPGPDRGDRHQGARRRAHAVGRAPQGLGTAPVTSASPPTAAACSRPTRARTRSPSSRCRRSAAATPAAQRPRMARHQAPGAAPTGSRARVGPRRGGRRRGGRGAGLRRQPAAQAGQARGSCSAGSRLRPIRPSRCPPPGVRPGRRKLVWIAAKGLGVGPNDRPGRAGRPHEQVDSTTTPRTARATASTTCPNRSTGLGGVTRFPSDRRLAKLTPRASRQIRPVNAQKPPEGTPLAPGGPIEHVFYIVRENRTYDQILGDVKRGDGDPKLTVFGKDVTPNVHALVQPLPTARPRLRELRGVDRRPLLVLGRVGLRLRRRRTGTRTTPTATAPMTSASIR